MGDILKFSAKAPEKTEEEGETIQIMACGSCDNPTFFLSTDSRLFCSKCTAPVATVWTIDEDGTAA